MANAEAAYELLATARSYDLLFSDISLGSGQSGVQLADSVARLRPTLPVLLTTGLDVPHDSTAQYEVLPKPYRREELDAAIRRVMRRAPAAPALRSSAADAAPPDR